MSFRKFRWLWLLCIEVGLCSLGFAQDDPCLAATGGFAINGTGGNDFFVGCSPLTVNVENTVVDLDSIAYAFYYRAGIAPVYSSAKTATYDSPGRYVIVQVGTNSKGERTTHCREIRVKSVVPPRMNAVYCSSDSTVKVTFVNDSLLRRYKRVQVEWGDGSPTESRYYAGDNTVLEHRYAEGGTHRIRYRGLYVENFDSCPGSEEGSVEVTVGAINIFEKIKITHLAGRADGSFGLSLNGVSGIESEVMIRTGLGSYRASGVKSSQGGEVVLAMPPLDPNQFHCFQLRSTDGCGNTVISNEVCSTTLSGRAEEGLNELTWNQYPEPGEFVRYELLHDNTRIGTFDERPEITYVDDGVSCGSTSSYTIVAVTQEARSQSAPIALAAPKCEADALFLPDAFTPNGDGVNDYFMPSNASFEYFQMTVYNRWGQAIFQTDDAAEGWNGMADGTRVDRGLYVYKVAILDRAGKEYFKTSTVLLLR